MTQPTPQPGQYPPPSDPAPGGAAAKPSIGTLFASVTSQISGIVRDEIELNKTKLRSFASKSGKGAALLVSAANTRYIGGGMDLAPQADPTDGLLEVVRLDPCGRLSVLALLRRVFAGTHVGRPGVHLERSRSLTIEPWPDDGAGGWLRDPPHPYADGERLAGLPLHLEVVPQAVGLLLPA